MIKNNPLVTVLMPVYNAEKYLSKAIESILSQTFVDFEFIIINDASTDSSEEIILSYTDTRVRYLKNEQNLSVAKTLNKGIQSAQGKYIVRMDADDISVPNRLELQVGYLEENPSVDVVFSNIELINTKDQPLKHAYVFGEVTEEEKIIKILPEKNCLAHPTVCIKSSILKKYQYRSEIKSEDWDLWLRLISDHVKINKMSERLLRYRTHGGSLTHKYNLGSGIHVIKDLSRFIFFQTKNLKFGPTERSVLRTVIQTSLSTLPSIISLIVNSVFRTLSCFWALAKTSWKDKVIFFFPDYGWGGAEAVHLDIVRQINRNKKVFIVFRKHTDWQPNYLEEFRKNSNGVCILFHDNVFHKYLRSYIKFKLDRIPKTIIFGSNTDFFYDVINGVKKHKVIDLLHAFGADVERLALPVIDDLDQRVIITESTRHKLKKQYKKEGIDQKYLSRVHCIPNAIPVNTTYPERKNFDRLNLLFVGRRSYEKRIYLIRDLIKKLVENEVDFTFTGVGGDFGLCTIFSDLPQVRCLGQIERSQLKEVYHQANVLLITSRREGFPIVMMEGMTEGVIPVSTAVGGIPDNITHNENGLLISNHENDELIVESFFQNLMALQSDKKKMEQLSEAAFQYAKENFSLERFNAQYDSLFGIKTV